MMSIHSTQAGAAPETWLGGREVLIFGKIR